MIVYDVWAEWCAPCKKFSPIFEKVAKEFESGATFVKINADESPAFLQRYAIRSIPTLLVVDGESGDVLFQHAGILSEANLRNLVSTYLLQSHK